MSDFEKLGLFYLGRRYDPATRTRSDAPVLYDSKDLVTHAVCVGMTGSGKTGLCIGLLEEAAIDGVPAIVIDPKGDLSNLLLTFPDLRAQDFRPWISEEDAQRKGIDPDTHAAQQAQRWKAGLEEWGQDGARISRLRESAHFDLYTPGSNAGTPVAVLRSFACPPHELSDDAELFRERISSTVTSLLGLIGVEADPLKSREHILLSTIFDAAWSRGRDLDLSLLIHDIQQPPVTRVGVMELETFFPAADRFTLAMSLNNLIASPGFSRWTEGVPLDIASMLRAPDGKPRIAIFSIAHLSDAERMFFVSLLLGHMLGWVRTQSGTTSLRALLYMDEIAGYFPPVATPPSKGPLLTLMKQARAFGVGVVLATQNPVDLDYKGLANAGTWFIGRLQTERDKARVLDGLEGAMTGAGASFDRAAVDALLSSLGTRVFLMNNIHDDGPTVFETRWAMSYLRGPLTRAQVRALSQQNQAPASDAPPAPASLATPAPARRAASTVGAAPAAAAAADRASSSRPVLPPEVPQFFVPLRAGLSQPGAAIEYHPMLLGSAKVHYLDARRSIETEVITLRLASIHDGPVIVDWDESIETTLAEDDLVRDPAPGVRFAPLPAEAGRAKSYDAWKRSFAEMLHRTQVLELYRASELELMSEPGESRDQFLARLRQAARERRDAHVAALREKYAPKFATLEERRRKAQQALEVQQEQARASKAQTAISFGAAVLGAFFGKKALSSGNVGRAATAARGVTRSSKESSDVDRAEQNLQAIDQQIQDLRAKLDEESASIVGAASQWIDGVDSVVIKPKKTAIAVRALVLAWAPHIATAHEGPAPAW